MAAPWDSRNSLNLRNVAELSDNGCRNVVIPANAENQCLAYAGWSLANGVDRIDIKTS
jgi:hypothetical protein